MTLLAVWLVQETSLRELETRVVAEGDAPDGAGMVVGVVPIHGVRLTRDGSYDGGSRT